jgi:hypothetical protein
MPTSRSAAKQLEANFQTILGPEGGGGSHAMGNRTPSNAAVSVATYWNDPLYPRIVRAVAAILKRGKTVAAVDVLIGMGLLTPEHLEAWRRGRIPYLEQVIDCNLTRLSRLLRILRLHVHDLKLVPPETVYVCYGKGRQRLRFTKTGDAKLERAYARHFIWPGKGPFHLPATNLLSRCVVRMRKKCNRVRAN